MKRMAEKPVNFQPGVILHAVIIGAFRMKGLTLHHWCKEQGVHQTQVRNATYGQSSGQMGQDLLNRVIDAAGRDVVTDLYVRRMRDETARLAS